MVRIKLMRIYKIFHGREGACEIALALKGKVCNIDPSRANAVSHRHKIRDFASSITKLNSIC
jgi:hypothetical protein